MCEFIGENEFLLKYNKRSEYNSDLFKSAKLTWRDLMDVIKHYRGLKNQLEQDRLKFISKIQDINGVHSIRSRLKDEEHLIEKIIRKVAKNGKRIDKTNYLENITDIIGVRIIHISRFESYPIFQQLQTLFKDCFYEAVTIKLREGDDESAYAKLVEEGAVIEKQKKYRSIHYTIKNNSEALIELQTRTLFEEGWSEIDHDAVYKAVKKDAVIDLSSSILSRLAGTCDDLAALMLKPQIETRQQKQIEIEKFCSNRDLLAEFIKNH